MLWDFYFNDLDIAYATIMISINLELWFPTPLVPLFFWLFLVPRGLFRSMLLSSLLLHLKAKKDSGFEVTIYDRTEFPCIRFNTAQTHSIVKRIFLLF